MSSNKGALRRMSLLAGSSLMAASLSAIAFTGVALTPEVALADNECTPIGVDPSANGATADSYECAATTYATGITYDSEGDLDVTKTNTGNTTVTADGVNLTGTDDDAVTWDSSIGNVVGGAGTAGPVIDVTTATGDINILTSGVTATQAGTTHAIRATSTGGGDITITKTTTPFINNTAADGQAAIEAVTAGGDIEMNLTGTVNGRLRGILAQTSGSGTVTLNTAGNVSANATDGLVAIRTAAGSGLTEINIAGGTISGGAGVAMQATSSGAVVVNNTGGTIGSINFNMPNGGGAFDFSGVTGGVTFTNAGASSTSGRWLGMGDSVFGSGADVLTFAGVGLNYLGGRTTPDASIDFGAGNDTLNLSAFFNMGAFTQDAGEIDFGSGQDTFDLGGVFTSSGGTLANLEALNLSGTILMGVASSGNNANSIQVVWDQTDGVPDDILRVHGATLTGSGDGRIVMDVDLGAGQQAGCAMASGFADCLDLTGGATAGVTTLVINNLAPPARQGGYDPIGLTLVDVGGGTSAAGHFVLDPGTDGLQADPTYGQIIVRPGLFSTVFTYDPATQRHVLVSLPRIQVMEYAMLSGAAQSIWHMTAETVTDRQTDLRGAPDTGALWMRTTGEYSQRDAASSFEGVGQTYAVDNTYKLYAGTIMGGLDLVQGHSGGYDYVVGAQIGYVGSSFELDASPSTGRFTGATGGVYGSVWTPGAFLDATFNLNGLTLDYDAPELGSKTNTYTTAFGGRLEGGLRYRLSDIFLLEPLATLAFVRTGFEEISLSGGEVRPDDAQSRRAALGLRVGGDIDGQTINWSYFLTGRAWNEFDGEANGVVNNPGADLPFMDEFDGTFGQVEAGLSLYNDANTLSGFASSGVKWKDGYSAIDLSLGLRMAW